MELFFLCTIALAIVSFISMALAQPPVATVLNPEKDQAPKTASTNPQKEASIIEFKKELTEIELIALATA